MAEEEGRHEPTEELWWNESWYFDVAAEDGSFGAYVRIGLVPNQDRCWYLLHLTTPERTVRIDDQQAPLPSDPALTVHGIAHEESGVPGASAGARRRRSSRSTSCSPAHRAGRPPSSWTSPGPRTGCRSTTT